MEIYQIKKTEVHTACFNPVIPLDYPDPDVIRVGETYYLASTTMHFFPGCEILKSGDLVHWEHAAYVYDSLDGTPGQKLEDGKGIYGKGMWAPSLRYHEGIFYLMFVANDTGKTYLYRASDIAGPWEKSIIRGFYHDGSLLFDEGKVYVAYGNRQIRLTELDAELTGPKEGGLDRVLVTESEDNHFLGYEGSHLYKIRGKYYLFLIHSRPDRWMRTESCFYASALTGEWKGGDILCDDMGYFGQGVAQGGIVNTPDGAFYAMLFQDRGGSGRMPVLLPVTFKGDMPVIGSGCKVPANMVVPGGNLPRDPSAPGSSQLQGMPLMQGRREKTCRSLTGSDDFRGGKPLIEDPGAVEKTGFSQGKTEPSGELSQSGRVTLDPLYDSFGFRSFWQFNHEPIISLVEKDTEKGRLLLHTDRICRRMDLSINTLTQRLTLPWSRGRVTLAAEGMKPGDRAGLGILCEDYIYVAMEQTVNGPELIYVQNGRKEPGEYPDEKAAEEAEKQRATEGDDQKILWRLALEKPEVQVRVEANTFAPVGNVTCAWRYVGEETFKPLPFSAQLRFTLKHFVGGRFALFAYSTKEAGGCAAFSDFVYETR